MADFACPHCGWQARNVPSEWLGRTVRCKQCQGTFTLPAVAPPDDAFLDELVAARDQASPSEAADAPPTATPAKEKKRRRGGIVMWWISIGCSLLAVWVLLSLMTAATSAIQETTACALALAVAIIPYCLARAASEISDRWRS